MTQKFDLDVKNLLKNKIIDRSGKFYPLNSNRFIEHKNDRNCVLKVVKIVKIDLSCFSMPFYSKQKEVNL